MTGLEHDPIFSEQAAAQCLLQEIHGIQLQPAPERFWQPALSLHLGISTSYEGLPYPLVTDGKVQYKYLSQLGLTLVWLKEELRKKGVKDPADVLLASLDTSGELYVVKKESAELSEVKIME
jgi:hypothetical protein